MGAAASIPPTAMTQPFPLGSLLFAPLLFLPLPSPLLSQGSGGMTMTPGNFFELQMLIGEF